MLIINTRNKTINSKYRLSQLQLRLLLLLSDNEVHEYKEILKYLYYDSNDKLQNRLRIIISRLRKNII
jgi:DNA-binding response OmpR family regulator